VSLPLDHPVSQDRAADVHDIVFAPWVKALNLEELTVGPGWASAVLPQQTHLQWASGATCGQALMAAIDTVAAMAMMTSERQARGTASQHTQFLRPAFGEDMLVRTEVLRFGGTIAYAESRVTFIGSGDLVAHSTCEFVF
jgi:acyl-coenzyme A thioesterase PaaI-like protein